MKKIIASLAVVFFALVLFNSCTKTATAGFSQDNQLPDRIISAKITPGQEYTVTIDNSGELSISKQAMHFQISQAGIDPKNNARVYRYVAAEEFTGNDKVELVHRSESVYTSTVNSSCYGSSGPSMTSRTSYIVVNIQVVQ